MLIDFHTHAFPERIAARAVGSLAEGSGGMVPQTEGTLASLKEQMDKDGWIFPWCCPLPPIQNSRRM